MSRYSITATDISTKFIQADDYLSLLGDASIDDVINESENLFDSFLGGSFTSTANITLAKPFIIFIILYNLHLRRSNNPDYTIDEQVVANYENTIKWCSKIGLNLLSKEGNVSNINSNGIEYTAPTRYYGMSSTSRLF